MLLLALLKNTHLGNEDEASDAASDEQQGGQRLRGKVPINSKITGFTGKVSQIYFSLGRNKKVQSGFLIVSVRLQHCYKIYFHEIKRRKRHALRK
jgi:hypothetical protein